MISLDLRALYQETILDHSKSPRNFRELDGAEHHAEGFNPLCGDHIHVWVDIDGDVIREITFQGQGCAISTASASLLTQHLRGKTTAEARRIFERFQKMVTSDCEIPVEESTQELGKLAALAGVREFPVRVKCATLGWHTLIAALEDRDQPVSTEE